MNIDRIPPNAKVFLDANILIYHFAADLKYGDACTRLIERVEQKDVNGFTSADVLSDVSHRLMTIEALQQFGWPVAGIAMRLRQHHADISKLTLFQRAIDSVSQLGISVFDVSFSLVSAATKLSRQFGLLTGDATIIAAMQSQGIALLASNDTDFDRIPTITRCSVL